MRSLVIPAILALSIGAIAQRPTRPDAFLGRPLGADFHLPDWAQVKGYFEKLDGESGRVELRNLGKTTEGRDFVLAVISSESNLARIDELKRYAAICHDPRGKSRDERLAAIEKGRPFVFVSCAMHATECASPQFAMQLAWELATSDDAPYKAAREQCVVLLAPSLNPDGLDHVVEWYRKTVNTPYEASELPKLYQYYCGHDNNRDWFALTQKETRIVTQALYFDWKPQVYWDVHQQGSRQERMFVPPFRDPLNANLDPAIVCAMNLLGTRAQFDMTREGLTGTAGTATCPCATTSSACSPRPLRRGSRRRSSCKRAICGRRPARRSTARATRSLRRGRAAGGASATSSSTSSRSRARCSRASRASRASGSPIRRRPPTARSRATCRGCPSAG
jgi:Zinc carboxypeptidase